MAWMKVKALAATLAALALVGSGGVAVGLKAAQGTQASESSKVALLPPQRFEDLHRFFKPQADPSGLVAESAYLDSVPWISDPREAIRRSFRENKPIFAFWSINAPLGIS